MSDFETFRDSLGVHAKDIKINLSTVLSPEGAPDLTQEQIDFISLASAYATRSPELIQALKSEVSIRLSDEQINVAKSAATIMAMNNVYYRFTHLVQNESVTKLPAKLRMTVLANHGLAKVDFELAALAVSAINGCGMCMDAHVHEILKQGATPLAVQSAVRIAAVLNAAAQATVQ